MEAFLKVNYVIQKIRPIKKIGMKSTWMIKSKVDPIFDLANTKRKVLLLMSDENLLDKNNFFAPFSIKKPPKHINT